MKPHEPRSLLEQAGLRITEPRLRLVSLLRLETRPRPATYLAKKLKNAVDAVTVYRALESLLKAGLVARTDFHHGHSEYELVADRPHHHHLVCTACGLVEDVTSCNERILERSALAHSKHFTAVRAHALEFFGRCTQCS